MSVVQSSKIKVWPRPFTKWPNLNAMWDVWLISRLNTVQGDQPYQTPASNPTKGVTYLSNIALPPATWASVQHCRDPSRVVMYACVFLFLCPPCIGNEEKYGHCHLSRRNLDGHRQLNLWDFHVPQTRKTSPAFPHGTEACRRLVCTTELSLIHTNESRWR